MDPQAPASLSYLCIPDAVSSEDAWLKLLKRAPRPLVGWENYNDVGGPQRLAGYNFSADLPAWRASKDPNVRQQTFRITRTVEGIEFKFGSLRSIFDNKNLSLLNEHLMLKMLLNTHSTLVMGRMGRYHGNVMTCVRPSNFKLIDRTIRYIQMLLKHEGIQCYTYEDICLKCFVELETAEVNEPIVLKVFERCKKKDELTGASASDSSVCSDKKIYSPSTGRDASSSAT
jgi:N-acetylmuramic acid 6-phosphate etherase